MKKYLHFILLGFGGLGTYLALRNKSAKTTPKTTGGSPAPTTTVKAPDSNKLQNLIATWDSGGPVRVLDDINNLQYNIPFAVNFENPNTTLPLYVEKMDGRILSGGDVVTNFSIPVDKYFAPGGKIKQFRVDLTVDLFRTNALLADKNTIANLLRQAYDRNKAVFDRIGPGAVTVGEGLSGKVLLTAQNGLKYYRMPVVNEGGKQYVLVKQNMAYVDGPASAITGANADIQKTVLRDLYRSISFGRLLTAELTVFWTGQKGQPLYQSKIQGSLTL